MIPEYWYFNPCCTQKWHEIFLLRPTSVSLRPPKMVGPLSLKISLTSVSCSQKHIALGLDDAPSEIQSYLEPELKQRHTEMAYDMNNSSEAAHTRQPFNYCSTFTYFHVMNTRVKLP